MGWQARNRLPDLRGAPLSGRANGHDLSAGKQIVQFDPMLTAILILDSVLPGNPMPIVVAPGQAPIMGKQIDWTEYAEKLRASLPAGDWTPMQTHHFNVANAVAAFQRASMACAAAAEGLRKAAAPPDDALPLPPEGP